MSRTTKSQESAVTLRRILACALGIIVLGMAFPLFGHHGFEGHYDINKKITITGSVTRVEWENPHVHCYLDVKDANGAVAHYVAEGGAPRNLNRHGWTPDTLKIGETVTIQGYMSRDGSNSVSGLKLTLPNGQKLDMQF